MGIVVASDGWKDGDDGMDDCCSLCLWLLQGFYSSLSLSLSLSLSPLLLVLVLLRSSRLMGGGGTPSQPCST